MSSDREICGGLGGALAGFGLMAAIFPPAAGMYGLAALGAGAVVGYQGGSSTQSPGEINGIGELASVTASGAVGGLQNAVPVASAALMVSNASSSQTSIENNPSQHAKEKNHPRFPSNPPRNSSDPEITTLPRYGGHYGVPGVLNAPVDENYNNTPSTTPWEAAKELYNATDALPPVGQAGEDLNFTQIVPDPHSPEVLADKLERVDAANAEWDKHTTNNNE